MNVFNLMRIINRKLPPYIWAWIAKYKNYEEQTGSGTLVFENTYGQKFSKFDVEGQTEQESTNGNQLIDFSILNKISATLTFEDDILDIIFTHADGNVQKNIKDIVNNNIGKTIKFGYESINGSNYGCRLFYRVNSGDNLQYVNLLSRTFTIEQELDAIGFQFYNNGSANNEILITKPLLYFDDNDTYEPYTGGIPRTKSILSISY